MTPLLKQWTKKKHGQTWKIQILMLDAWTPIKRQAKIFRNSNLWGSILLSRSEKFTILPLSGLLSLPTDVESEVKKNLLKT